MLCYFTPEFLLCKLENAATALESSSIAGPPHVVKPPFGSPLVVLLLKAASVARPLAGRPPETRRLNALRQVEAMPANKAADTVPEGL